MYLLKRGTTWNHLKAPKTFQQLSESSEETTDITWNQPGTYLRISNAYGWTKFTEQNDSANRMYLLKVLRRQTIDIINIINVVPVSLLLILNNDQHLL